MEAKKAKRFRLFDAVLATVCVILVVEAAAPSAAIGNSKYFWWIIAMIGFFLPYGLATAELGTTYSDGGGLYDWVARAYGRKWGSRVAWYYWVHFALWIAALGVLFTEILGQVFDLHLNMWVAMAVQLAFIWIVAVLSMLPVSDSKLLINICTLFKVLIMVALGALGVHYGMTYGVANPVNSARDLMPGIAGISFIAMIMFNFKGFEVVTAFASEMKNPQKEIPKALLMGGILIIAFYLFASFGMAVAIPIEELSTYGGLMDSFYYFINNFGLPSVLLPIIAIMFLYSLFANPVVWALGVNYVAVHAAENNAMPAVFAKKTRSGAPIGAVAVCTVVASVLIIAAPFIPDPDIFWGFFALQILMMILAYIPMFPAFKRLRSIDADTVRPYRVPGGKVIINLVTYSPMIMLILAGVLVAVYPNYDGTWTFETLMIIGTVIFVIIGEIIAYTSGRRELREVCEQAAQLKKSKKSKAVGKKLYHT